ncbi:MAG: hypothetical protein ABI648_05335 [Betaproteobacteria bacterium]
MIDSLSANCSVIRGSHNLGFKASYFNDENMLLVTGHRDLAVAYAVHVLDVYDHCRCRFARKKISVVGTAIHRSNPVESRQHLRAPPAMALRVRYGRENARERNRAGC